MEVHFTAEQEELLNRVSTRAGIEPENFVRDAALRMMHENEGLSAAVRQGLLQANRGELVDDDEVRLWIENRERA
jgi:predicted transcriptional regulator